MAPKSRVRRVLSTLTVNPLTTVVSLVVVVLQTNSTGRGALYRWRHEGLQPLTVANLHQRHPRTSPPLFVVRDGDSFRLLNPDRESWDEAARALREHPENVLQIQPCHGYWGRGVWAVTRFDNVVSLLLSGGASFSEADRARARVVAFPNFPELQRGDIETHTVVWNGYLTNAVTLCALVVFPFSWGWIPPAVRGFRAAKRRRAIGRGRCPHCGYSLAGLDNSKCPECGTEVSSAPSGAGSQ